MKLTPPTPVLFGPSVVSSAFLLLWGVSFLLYYESTNQSLDSRDTLKRAQMRNLKLEVEMDVGI